MTPPRVLLAGLVALALAWAGCGGSTAHRGAGTTAADASPPGDIPDNQAYVAYTPPGGSFSVKAPEGWSRVRAGGAVTFADKLNSVRIEARNAAAPVTLAAAKRTEVPALARSVRGFRLRTVTKVRRTAGPAIRTTYLARSKPDAVTGRARDLAVERYEFRHGAREVVLTLSGAKGADNVDPWRIVTNSVRFGA
jgi:hypothetical protein